MSRWYLIIEDDDNKVVGQFDVGSQTRREYIKANLPDDLSIRNDGDLSDPLQTLSDNVVDWDDRLNDL